MKKRERILPKMDDVLNVVSTGQYDAQIKTRRISVNHIDHIEINRLLRRADRPLTSGKITYIGYEVLNWNIKPVQWL